MNRRIRITPQQKLYLVLNNVESKHDSNGPYVMECDLPFKLPSEKSCADGYDYLYNNLKMASSWIKAFEMMYKDGKAANELTTLSLCKNYSAARNIRNNILTQIKDNDRLYKRYLKIVHDTNIIDYSKFSRDVSCVLQAVPLNTISELRDITINDIVILPLSNDIKRKILTEVYDYLLTID